MTSDFSKPSFHYTFPNGQTAYILDVPSNFSHAESLNVLGLKEHSPSMVVIGGASEMSSESKMRVSQLFTKVLAPFAETNNITVFDGGTNAGIIQMMGQARRSIGGSFNLVGIAPKAHAKLPGHSLNLDVVLENSEEIFDLEQHHSHFVLVPGFIADGESTCWGSESPWLANCASILAGHYPSITVLINGGKISLSDLELNLLVGRHTIVVAGSGRLADKIANTINGTAISEEDSVQGIVKMYYPNQLSIFELTNSLDSLTSRLESHFQ
ncbi:MAG: hypothetical protein F6K11_22035 [Leptolyngbya sp. SIO3F4]|nr:hypothetical protein [Leptolyngbya sp. SIO3F4]